MKRKLAIFMVLLPVLLGAGAWTQNSVAKTHGGAVPYSSVGYVVSYVSAFFVKAIDFASQLTEQAWFLALGACFVCVALALHRKSAKPKGE
jgi:hypothetical protein